MDWVPLPPYPKLYVLENIEVKPHVLDGKRLSQRSLKTSGLASVRSSPLAVKLRGKLERREDRADEVVADCCCPFASGPAGEDAPARRSSG